MPSEPPTARIVMVVIDPAHPRYGQEGQLIDVPEEDADGRAAAFTLVFAPETFTAAQVRLVRE
jgi:hypothetical protein